MGLPSIQKLAAYISKPLYIRKPSGTIAVPKEKKTSVYDVNLRLAIATGATGQAGMVMDFVNGMPEGRGCLPVSTSSGWRTSTERTPGDWSSSGEVGRMMRRDQATCPFVRPCRGWPSGEHQS